MYPKRVGSERPGSVVETARDKELASASLTGGMVLTLMGPGGGEGFSVVRQYSTSPSERIQFCTGTSIFILGIGVAFAALGAWPVLYFALALVGAILFIWNELERHRDDHEIISIGEQTLDIAIQQRRSRERHSFQRYWVRPICLNEGEHIVLRSHGRQVEIGVGLTQDDKLMMFRYLARVLGRH
jgi:uncharacterized membrane protein